MSFCDFFQTTQMIDIFSTELWELKIQHLNSGKHWTDGTRNESRYNNCRFFEPLNEFASDKLLPAWPVKSCQMSIKVAQKMISLEKW